MRKEIVLNGVLVGHFDATGDSRLDAEAMRTYLRKRGLWKEVPRGDVMFGAALGFANTAAMVYHRDLEHPPHRAISVAPFAVNSAFAIELYLKALTHRHGGKVSRVHGLSALFKGLPTAALEAVAMVTPRCAIACVFTGPRDLGPHLARLNNAFVEWRYFFETDSGSSYETDTAIFVMKVLDEAFRNPTP